MTEAAKAASVALLLPVKISIEDAVRVGSAAIWLDRRIIMPLFKVLAEHRENALERAEALRDQYLRLYTSVMGTGAGKFDDLLRLGDSFSPRFRALFETRLAQLQQHIDDLNQSLAQRAVPLDRKARVGRLSLEDRARTARQVGLRLVRGTTGQEPPAEPSGNDPVGADKAAQRSTEQVEKRRVASNGRSRQNPNRSSVKGGSVKGSGVKGSSAKGRKETAGASRPRPGSKGSKSKSAQSGKTRSAGSKQAPSKTKTGADRGNNAPRKQPSGPSGSQ